MASAVHRVMLFGGDVAKKARGGYSAIPNQTSDTLRYASIPLVHGPGVIPAVGFGTLIHDPCVAKQATKSALEVGYRHLDCAERYRTEEAVGEAMQELFRAGTIRRHDVFVRRSYGTPIIVLSARSRRLTPADNDCKSTMSIAT